MHLTSTSLRALHVFTANARTIVAAIVVVERDLIFHCSVHADVVARLERLYVLHAHGGRSHLDLRKDVEDNTLIEDNKLIELHAKRSARSPSRNRCRAVVSNWSRVCFLRVLNTNPPVDHLLATQCLQMVVSTIGRVGHDPFHSQVAQPAPRRNPCAPTHARPAAAVISEIRRRPHAQSLPPLESERESKQQALEKRQQQQQQ